MSGILDRKAKPAKLGTVDEFGTQEERKKDFQFIPSLSSV